MAAEEILDLDNDLESRIEQRNLLLKDVDRTIIQKAWFTLSHLLLEEGARVLDMGCNDGMMTYAMAVLYPKIKFVGIDKSKRQINKAREKYQLHNLDFKIGDVSSDLFEPESIDAIVNSNVLHEVYSGSRYNEQTVSDTLAVHFRMLKKGGLMFIRDFARPPPEEFVLIEMPDKPSAGKDLANMSEPDLLIWYAEHARPRNDAGTGGFFLEELPARFPKTRLFRLPYKWAYEFIMRKDDRTRWETELPMEYTFFTMREFRKEIRQLGARAQYTAPVWNEEFIEQNFEGRFRLYDDNGTPLGYPPTSFVAVAVKMAERKSLHIHERRPSAIDDTPLKITAMRDQKTGAMTDVVSSTTPISEVIPYRIDENGSLKVYLHDGVPRSIVNAVPRQGISLDDRRWSGHMLEPVAVDQHVIFDIGTPDIKTTVLFARDYLGLKPQNEAILETGPDYYPEPGYIDERIFTYYLKVEQNRNTITPRKSSGYIDRFQARGALREMDAQQVLDAITVGLIPNARLELQLLALFQNLDIQAENWTQKQIRFQIGKLAQGKKLKDMLKEYDDGEKHFKEVMGTTGDLRPVHSIFVEEGQTRGSITGLSSQEIDFVVFDDKTINTAVVLPLSKGLKENVHAGFTFELLPVPERHEGNGLCISAPQFNLPRNITNIKLAKKFIAEKFGVEPENVIKLGESYFSHIGLTQQKIHPFAVSVPASATKAPDKKFLPFYQLMLLRRSLAKNTHFMVLIARAYRYLHDELRLDAKMSVKAILKDRFAHNMPDWSLPLNYTPAPSMIYNPAVHTLEDEEELDEKIKAKQEAKVAAKPKPPEQTKDFHASKELAPNLIDDFESELEEFFEDLEAVEELKPQPKEW